MSKKPPYWTNPMVGSFKVFIDSTRENKGQHQIHIREDVIRPAGGGQAGDRGLLIVGEKKVLISDTVIDSGQVALISDSFVAEKSEGQLEIDLNWRMAMMRNHTAEHLVVGILKRTYPTIEVGDLWIDGNHGSVEFRGISVSLNDIFKAESEVHKIVSHDIPVLSEYVDADSIDASIRAREGLTLKHEKLRVVKVGDLDSSACSGIHVERTSQIGFFKVIDVKYSNDNTRVEFMSGDQAISKVSDLYNSVLHRKGTYPFEMEQIGPVLDRAKSAVEERSKMKERITKLVFSEESEEQIGGITFKHEFLPGFESKDLRNLANQIKFSKTSVLLLFAPGPKSQVIFRTFKTPHNAEHYISEVVKKHGGSGGGSSDNFTGGFTDVANPEDLYEKLISSVRNSLNQ
ncbi:MAG: hypothetical protein ACW987_13665 [Candidatus Thorarchaeota archaeon]